MLNNIDSLMNLSDRWKSNREYLKFNTEVGILEGEELRVKITNYEPQYHEAITELVKELTELAVTYIRYVYADFQNKTQIDMKKFLKKDIPFFVDVLLEVDFESFVGIINDTLSVYKMMGDKSIDPYIKVFRNRNGYTINEYSFEIGDISRKYPVYKDYSLNEIENLKQQSSE